MEMRLIVMKPVVQVKLHDVVQPDQVIFAVDIIVKQDIFFVYRIHLAVVFHPHFPNLAPPKTNIGGRRE